MALDAGETLSNGQYRIVTQLGRGGFGFVYLADDTLVGEKVAIKELIPALVGGEAILKRFLAEARATMRLIFRSGSQGWYIMNADGTDPTHLPDLDRYGTISWSR